MRRFVPGFAVIAVLLAPLPAAAEIVSAQEAMTEMVLGRNDAPLTIIEYSSLGCPHCASFHRETLPKFKAQYIDTGKVRLIYRDFPLGTPAMAASMIARCAGPDRFFGFIEILFRSQAQWSRSPEPLTALTRVARFGGMTEADVQACLKLQALMDAIREGAATAQKTHEINSTPSFIIGDQVVTGTLGFEKFKKIIDQELNK